MIMTLEKRNKILQDNYEKLVLQYNILDRNYKDLCSKNMHAPPDQIAEIERLRAHINVLREALEGTVSSLEGYRNNIDDLQLCDAERIAQQALAKTPAQSLQAHDDEVIERCAVIGRLAQLENKVVNIEIRALKGKQNE